jgi:hypothetical protein
MLDPGMGMGMGPTMPSPGPDPALSQVPGTGQTTMVPRDRPTPDDARRKLVTRWQDRVKRAKRHWRPQFKRMRENMEFVEGRQWPDLSKEIGKRDDRYVANICIRHVLQRTAELYPNNPKMQAKVKPKLIAQTWDGTEAQLMQAQQSAMQAAQVGMPPDPHSMMILQDAAQVQQFDAIMKKIGKTLELLYEYNIQEQTHSFKSSMKMSIRRAIVTSVGYVKLGFQRAMKMSPEIEHRIADMSERVANIERLASDLADREIEPDSADAEELKLAIRSLTAETQLVVREGLTFDYPDSTAIIPDTRCRSLRGFLGANWVAQEYLLTPDEIEEIYMVDVGTSYTAYNEDGNSTGYEPTGEQHYSAGYGDGRDDGTSAVLCLACIWEIYNRKDGTVYVVCDGYPEFLQEPTTPEAEITRFWPWFAIVLNEGYDEKTLYPQSDIDLIRDMQLELNRSRQGLREHRRANRPKTAVAAGLLEEPDLEKLRTHPANALLELNALAPGQKIDDVLQVIKMPPIDAAVYDTAPVFEDVLRVLGSDQADQGTTSGNATATEVSVAQFSQNTDLTSTVDDINDTMTELAQASSQILVLNVSPQTVTKVVGPGAVWPALDPQTVADNVWLEVDVGANGPANRQEDVQVLTQLIPLLQRIPGISPEWLARQLMRRMGDDIDLTEAFAEGTPSIEALNQLMGRPQVAPGAPGEAPGAPGPGAGPGPTGAGRGPPRPPGPSQDPTAQGPVGMANAMTGPGTQGPLGPHVPPLQVYGANGNRPGTGGPARVPGRSQGMPTP